jgi:hypothetical protein
VTNSSDHPPGDRSVASPHSPASETGHSHLAHWPPPQRGHEVKPVLAKHHQAGETAQHVKPRGWGLTRSVFKDDSDE